MKKILKKIIKNMIKKIFTINNFKKLLKAILFKIMFGKYALLFSILFIFIKIIISKKYRQRITLEKVLFYIIIESIKIIITNHTLK